MSVDTHRIALITDSTADIPPELLERYGILVLPLYVLWGEETYRDGVDISKAAFYERIARETEPPKTSQPTPMDFVRLIRACHCQEALIIPLSGALSGTVNAAMQASDGGVPVHVEDSRAISMALGWQVLAARAGRRAVAWRMVAAAAQAAQRPSLPWTRSVPAPRRADRWGGGVLGTVLQLKPVLRMDTTTAAEAVSAVARAARH